MAEGSCHQLMAIFGIPIISSVNSQLRNWQMRRENKLAFSDTFQLHSTVYTVPTQTLSRHAENPARAAVSFE